MLKELGKYKDTLSSIFAEDNNICSLLLGQNYENEVEDKNKELKKYILPHLFMENRLTENKSYLLMETYVLKSNASIKEMKMVIQAICHKDIITYEEKPAAYYGLRYDVLSQYIEELLCPNDKERIKERVKQFGIGRLELQNVDSFLSNYYIGHTLTFTVPAFR
ncbi:MAG: hypothetical protein J5979_04100 [Lachnospiraceae bacterium]|nr:hypothetical protein [Lachnospiraceae bacterium]